MVIPTSTTKRSVRRRPRRSRNYDIIVVIVVTVVSVGLAWLVTLSLMNRQEKTFDTFAAPSLLMDNGKGGDIESENDNHLSAKNMLATKRPYLMYGTAWKKDKTASLVTQAIHAGFRFIDTACQPKHYNEKGVGLGIKTAINSMGLSREDIFVQTKFTSLSGQDPANIPYDRDAVLEDQVRQSVQASLHNLQTDYIDSLVLHSPMRTEEETMRVWRVFEEFVEEGKVHSLGISNCYKPQKFKRLYEQATIKPKILQNRFHEETKFDVELRRMCKDFGVTYQSFWTLTANRNALASPRWKAIAKEKDLTSQTLMYAFMMTLGHTPLSGTKDVTHMEEDVDVMVRIQRGEEILNENEMNRLSTMLGID